MAKTSDLFGLRSPIPKSLKTALSILSPVIFVLVWCVLSYGNIAPRDFLPTPTEVVKGILQLFFEHNLAMAVWISTKRIVIAFLLAAACAYPLGILMGTFRVVESFFNPLVAPLRYMPISAFIPLLILWFGIFEAEKIAFLWLGVFVYLLPVVVSAVKDIPEELIQTAKTLGATKWQIIRTVIIPASMPDIFDSFRVMNAISWTYVILAEAVNPQYGLGYMVELARTHSKPAWSFAGLVIIGGIGILTDLLIVLISKILFRWRDR